MDVVLNVAVTTFIVDLDDLYYFIVKKTQNVQRWNRLTLTL